MQSGAVVVPVSRGLQDPGRGLSPGLPGIPGAPAQQERAAGVEDLEDTGVERLRTRPFLANLPQRPRVSVGPREGTALASSHAGSPWPGNQGEASRRCLSSVERDAPTLLSPGCGVHRRWRVSAEARNDVLGPGTRFFPQMRSPAFQGGPVGKNLCVGGVPVLSPLLDGCGNLLPCSLHLLFRLVRSPLPLLPSGLRSQERTAIGGQRSPPSSGVRP